MRSVVVVFPASMCAMMPRFRVRSRGACLFKSSSENKGAAVPALHSGCGAERPSQHERGQTAARKRVLPAIVGKGFVGLCHPMHILPLFHRWARIVGRIEQFSGQPIGHAFPTSGLGVLGNPAQGERHPANGPNLHGHLVGGSTHPTRFHFHHRLDIINGSPKDFERIVARLFLDQLEGSVAYPLRRALLASRHQSVDELRHQLVLVAGILLPLPLPEYSPPRHRLPYNMELIDRSEQRIARSSELFATRCSLSHFGRFAPYFDRPCFLFATPTASRAPLTMWYRTPGRSLTRPPLTNTMECSCRL